uniref:Uncharacterized protein n=1 Tax=viral metagenome TaxID=1070528 RepID=A0A6C0K9R7_9ZZZZ
MPVNAATHKSAVMYCKGRHNVGSNEFITCYTKQTSPGGNVSWTNSSKNTRTLNGSAGGRRRKHRMTRRHRKGTRRH